MSLQTMSTKLNRVAEMAASDKELVFTMLFHQMSEELLLKAYQLVRKDGARGVDGISGEMYALNLHQNLEDLFQRIREKQYQAPMIRRVRIPKADGGERTLGITTFEDKIVQRAVKLLLDQVYEQDFLNCSYGYRPKRSAHQALESLWEQCREIGVKWIIDADIKSYFDTIPHGILQDIVRKKS